MRIIVIIAVFLSLCTTSCSNQSTGKSDLQAFDTLASAYDFMLYRNLISETIQNRKTAKRSSRTVEEYVGNRNFLIVVFNYVSPDRKVGIRGQNGPIYVLLEDDGAWILVGEFLGSRVDLTTRNDQLFALVYYHVSAAGTPPMEYPFINGYFNYIDPKAKGDVFK